MNAIKSTLPESSLLKTVQNDYIDCYSIPLNTGNVSIEQVGKSFFTSDPAWVSWLFKLRNKIVAQIGLKISDVEDNRNKSLANFHCEVGQQIGIFKVFDKNKNELILGEDDKHLDFRVSLFLDQQNNALTVSTIVKIHNWLGRLYFLPVKPIHKLIVPTMMNGILWKLQKDKE